MSLIDAYNTIKSTLRPQVQGTCGLYSFYNAVQILRQIDASLPSVPAPKKSEAAPGATQSLRQFAKRELKSGQGEILSEAEMQAFIKAWGYRSEAAGVATGSGKQDFLTTQTRGGHPVLIAYLADSDSTGIVPVPNAAAGDPGAHWSLVIGTKAKDMLVVEPNDPGNLRTWPMEGVMLANAAADSKKFDRFWEKTVIKPNAKLLRSDPGFQLPKDQSVGIAPLPNATGWAPSSGPYPQDPKYLVQDKTRLYDLGGLTGSRQDRQKLAHVMVALLPP